MDINWRYSALDFSLDTNCGASVPRCVIRGAAVSPPCTIPSLLSLGSPLGSGIGLAALSASAGRHRGAQAGAGAVPSCIGGLACSDQALPVCQRAQAGLQSHPSVPQYQLTLSRTATFTLGFLGDITTLLCPCIRVPKENQGDKGYDAKFSFSTTKRLFHSLVCSLP